MLREDDRKVLTELIGECWHEGILIDSKHTNIFYCSCKKEMTFLGDDLRTHCKKLNRSFTTQTDMAALFQRLWELGDWVAFYEFMYTNWLNLDERNPCDGNVSAWLFCLSGEGYEERCKLAAEWWRNVQSK